MTKENPLLLYVSGLSLLNKKDIKPSVVPFEKEVSFKLHFLSPYKSIFPYSM